ncbi:hypothetical protein M885DRAFT_338039 [Pelagophyceae sp. CCMP2097]|nr:hypothetical protein M885DRAFT_338039 [Pelagophyceae sp. CCMP2097]
MDSSSLLILHVVCSSGFVALGCAARLQRCSPRAKNATRPALVVVAARGGVVLPALGTLTPGERKRLDDASLAALCRDAVAGGVDSCDFEAHLLPRLTRLPAALEQRCERLCVRACAGLRTLDLDAFARLNTLALGLGGLGELALRRFVAGCPGSLTSLDLAGCSVETTDGLLAAISASRFSRGLVRLGVSGMKRLTMPALRDHVFAECPALTSIDASKCDGIDWTLLQEEDLPELSRLDVSRASPLCPPATQAARVSLCAILSRRPALRDLVVDGHSIRGAGRRPARAPAAGPGPAPRCLLRSLSAVDVDFADVARLLSAALRRLDVSAARVDVDALLRCAPTLASLRHLGAAALRPTSPQEFDDNALANLTAALPSALRHLDVSSNARLTPAGVERACAACPGLRVLRARDVGEADGRRRPRPAVLDVGGRVAGPRFCGPETCCGDASGARFVLRDAFHCLDCAVVAADVVCAACARRCHARHAVVYAGRINMFCDCAVLTHCQTSSAPEAPEDWS